MNNEEEVQTKYFGFAKHGVWMMNRFKNVLMQELTSRFLTPRFLSGGLVSGLTQSGALNIDLGSKGLDGKVAANDAEGRLAA
ncbi:MAG: hypothetical protein Q8L69_07460 [Gallionellaceae bacterium]|nr:hypothetical protein [Gallionellaceae bacterium]